jgi:TonB family protein
VPSYVASQKRSYFANTSLIVLVMRRVAILSFCFLLPLTASTQAQSSDQVLKDFRTQVLNQRLILQNFSADAETNFEWTANGLSSTPPKVRTLGVFKLSSAKLHKDSLELTGSRSILSKDKDAKPVLLGDVPIVIKIALNGADPAQVLPDLKQKLFFPTLQSAIAAIPLPYQKMLSLTDEPPKKLTTPLHPECPATGANFIRPRVIYQEAPEFTEEARRAHFNGAVAVLLTIDENGHVSDLWLKSPVGLGLDEQAMKAVSNYKFNPATCDGTGVKTFLMVEVNFAIR